MAILLLISIFIISTCGLIYELIAGTLASYLMGDTITQFSTIIGVYLFAMGIGSYLSKYIDKKLIETFIQIEIIIGLVGGFSAALLFVSFQYISHFPVLLYCIVGIIGICVGIEIPLLMRILKEQYDFKELVSKVFTFDYIGALLASLLFPLILVPYLGLIRTAFLFGLLNASIGFLALYLFKEQIEAYKRLTFQAFITVSLLLTGFVFSNQISHFSETLSYNGNIILTKKSHYQKIVLTRSGKDLRLHLNGNLQFSSNDEYRYHEALVHPGLSQLVNPKHVLVLGGGDGLAVREILKYPSIQTITVVDLDPEITKLFSSFPPLVKLNQNALNSDKVSICNEDAFIWMRNNQNLYDFIVIDFPDPSNFSLGKLYTNLFYKSIYNALAENGIAAIQSTSPFIARKSYWCIGNTLETVGFYLKSYQSYIPAFGNWGFHLVAKKDVFQGCQFLPELKYLTALVIDSLFVFPKDIQKVDTEINTLNNQSLVRYFEAEWSSYLE